MRYVLIPEPRGHKKESNILLLGTQLQRVQNTASFHSKNNFTYNTLPNLILDSIIHSANILTLQTKYYSIVMSTQKFMSLVTIVHSAMKNQHSVKQEMSHFMNYNHSHDASALALIHYVFTT